MTPSLQLVAEQFPRLRDRVACLFERDLVFRELCDDFEACSEALARPSASEDLRREFAALRLRLETELLRYLSADVESAGRRN
jgi:hypothetical protein